MQQAFESLKRYLDENEDFSDEDMVRSDTYDQVSFQLTELLEPSQVKTEITDHFQDNLKSDTICAIESDLWWNSCSNRSEAIAVTDDTCEPELPGSGEPHLLDLDDVSFCHALKSNTYQSTGQPSSLNLCSADVQNDVDLGQVQSILKTHIEDTCRRKLFIEPDPRTWSSADVAKWISFVSPNSCDALPAFQKIEGQILLALTESEFKSLSPKSGQDLYNIFVFWKNALQIKESPITYSYDHYFPNQFDFATNYPQGMTSCPSPAYSEDTMSSTSSCPSSTPSYIGNRLSPEADFMTPTKGQRINSGKSGNSSQRSGHRTWHLWQFLRHLLLSPRESQGCIEWEDREKGIFRIKDSIRVAKLWGAKKSRPHMNYDKLSRSIRQYYKKGIIKKTTQSKRLVYQFCEKYRT